MKKNRYKINPDSIFVSSLINIVFLLPLLILFITLCIFYNSINIKLIIYFSLFYIVISEILRRFYFNKWDVIKLVYKLKNIFIKIKNEYMYFLIDYLTSILNIIFIVFSFLYFLCVLNHSLVKSYSNDIINAVPSIITVISIILTLILALLQYISNKFPDFVDMLDKWKRNTNFLFVILLIYSTTSFTVMFFNYDLFNLWIYVTSVFFVIQLCSFGCAAVILMNDTGIINVKRHNIIKQIVSLPNIRTSDELYLDIENIVSPSISIKLKNYLINFIYGIVQETNYSFDEYFNLYLKTDLDSLFRVANAYIEKDNLGLFNLCINSINDIIQQIIIKTRGVEHFNIYEYFAAKQKLLFDNIIKYKREEYFIPIKDLNVNTIKGLIKESNLKYDILSCNTAISFLIEQLEYIIIKTSCFKHTTVTCDTISDLREISRYLIDKNDIHVTTSLIKTFMKIANTIDKLYQSKKWDIDIIWVSTIIWRTMNSLVNIIFYMVMASFNPNRTSYDYILKILAESYLDLYNIFAKYAMLNNCPTSSLYSIPNSEYEMLYNAVAKSKYVKTPYSNLVNKGVLSHITKVSCLAEVFGHVFISDFTENRLFNIAIVNLMRILDKIVVYIPIEENASSITLDNLIQFFNHVMMSAFLFLERIENLDLQIESYSKITKEFLTKLLNVSFLFFKSLYKTDSYNDFTNMYIKFLVTFIRYSKQIQNKNLHIEQLIYEKIDNIILVFEEEKDVDIRKHLFSNLKFLCIKLFEISRKTKTFKKLYKFIKSNQNNFPSHYNELSNIWEIEGLPHGSEYQISQETLQAFIYYIKRKTYNI